MSVAGIPAGSHCCRSELMEHTQQLASTAAVLILLIARASVAQIFGPFVLSFVRVIANFMSLVKPSIPLVTLY